MGRANEVRADFFEKLKKFSARAETLISFLPSGGKVFTRDRVWEFAYPACVSSRNPSAANFSRNVSCEIPRQREPGFVPLRHPWSRIPFPRYSLSKKNPE
jgi:hypothetical protein